jgi:DNA-binding GntR family transcriptional regulator
VKSISEMLGASVMPAREAMNRLIAEGALELRPNRSVIVPVLSRHEFDELTDLRCHIEGLAASRRWAMSAPRTSRACATSTAACARRAAAATPRPTWTATSSSTS